MLRVKIFVNNAAKKVVCNVTTKIIQIHWMSFFFVLAVMPVFAGCATNKLTMLHPLTGKDFCIKGDPSCNIAGMDYGMSEYFFNEVLGVSIEKDR